MSCGMFQDDVSSVAVMSFWVKPEYKRVFSGSQSPLELHTLRGLYCTKLRNTSTSALWTFPSLRLNPLDFAIILILEYLLSL